MSPEAIALIGAFAISVAVTRWVLVPTDEAWLLQVVRRVRGGDILYEDVFFGAGPLPVWLASLAVRISRPQIVVIRALGLVYAFAILLAGVALLRAAEVEPVYTAIFVLGALALGGHHLSVGGQYGQTSELGAIIAAVGVIQGEWLIVGLGIALAISGKYPLGVYALVWAVPLLGVEAGFGAALLAVLSIAAAGAVIAAVLGRDGVRSFISVAIANKGIYLATAAVNPIEDLRMRLRAPGPSPLYRAVTMVGPVAVFTMFALGGVAAVLGLALGIVERSTVLFVVGALSATGLAAAFPRADFHHQVAAMPFILLGIVLLADRAGPSNVVLIGAAVVLGFILAATLAAVLISTRRDDVRRDLPSLRLLPVTRTGPTWPDDTEAVIATAGNEVFVLQPGAAFFYLSGRLENPTRYDYPLAPTFGPDGQAEVASAIVSGEVPWVCYPGPLTDPLAPTELERLMEDRTPVELTPLGGLYVSEPVS